MFMLIGSAVVRSPETEAAVFIPSLSIVPAKSVVSSVSIMPLGVGLLESSTDGLCEINKGPFAQRVDEVKFASIATTAVSITVAVEFDVTIAGVRTETFALEVTQLPGL